LASSPSEYHDAGSVCPSRSRFRSVGGTATATPRTLRDQRADLLCSACRLRADTVQAVGGEAIARAPDIDDRNRPLALVEDRRRDAPQRLFELSQTGAVAAPAVAGELRLQPSALGHRRRREPLEATGQDRVALLLRKPGEERLPARGRVQR